MMSALFCGFYSLYGSIYVLNNLQIDSKYNAVFLLARQVLNRFQADSECNADLLGNRFELALLLQSIFMIFAQV